MKKLIQIGANVGYADGIPDITAGILLQDKYEAILVEPNPKALNKCKEGYAKFNYNLHFEEVAISSVSGIGKLYVDNFDTFNSDINKLPEWVPFRDEKIKNRSVNEIESWKGCSPHASLDINFQYSHLHGLGRDVITELEVKLITFDELIKKYQWENEEIEYLLIDTEGHDCDIILSTDFTKYKIKNIKFESTHSDGPFKKGEKLNNAITHLQNCGYNIVKTDVCDITMTKKITNVLFDPTIAYRTEFIDVLKQTGKHYESIISEYNTPNGEYNIKYYKWKHPYQSNWEYNEIFTDGILNGLKKLIRPDSVVLDIGAQIGLMSVGFAKFAKKVISFEPNPATFEVLTKNSEIYNNIIPYNLACSTIEDILEFHYSDEGFCNGGFAKGCNQGIGVTGHIIPMDVYAVNLFEFLNKYYKDEINNISLIKIDAEGHDNTIIKTIIPLINSVKPVIITEMYSGLTAYEVSELFNTLKDLNYTIYDIGNVNAGLESFSQRTEITSINNIKIGAHGNLLCLPK